MCPDDKKTYADVNVDLTKVDVQVDDEHTNKIQVNDSVSLLMKYPTINSVDPTKDYSKGANTSTLFDIISKSIYQIQEGDKTHMAIDYSKDEMDKFVEGLDSKSFKSIQRFYETMPKLRHELEVENPKTKVKSKVTLEGLTDFFG